MQARGSQNQRDAQGQETYATAAAGGISNKATTAADDKICNASTSQNADDSELAQRLGNMLSESGAGMYHGNRGFYLPENEHTYLSPRERFAVQVARGLGSSSFADNLDSEMAFDAPSTESFHPLWYNQACNSSQTDHMEIQQEAGSFAQASTTNSADWKTEWDRAAAHKNSSYSGPSNSGGSRWNIECEPDAEVPWLQGSVSSFNTRQVQLMEVEKPGSEAADTQQWQPQQQHSNMHVSGTSVEVHSVSSQISGIGQTALPQRTSHSEPAYFSQSTSEHWSQLSSSGGNCASAGNFEEQFHLHADAATAPFSSQGSAFQLCSQQAEEWSEDDGSRGSRGPSPLPPLPPRKPAPKEGSGSSAKAPTTSSSLLPSYASGELKEMRSTVSPCRSHSSHASGKTQGSDVSSHASTSSRVSTSSPVGSRGSSGGRSTSRYARVGSAADDPLPSTSWAHMLKSEVEEVKMQWNDNFGLVPVVNRFTRPTRDGPQGIDPEVPTSDAPIVLCRMLFGKHRVGLFQCLARLPSSGLPWVPKSKKKVGAHYASVTIQEFKTDCERRETKPLLVIEMDGGEDLCEVLSATPFKLTPGFPEAPYTPVKRIATAADRRLRVQREEQERAIMAKCKALLDPSSNKGAAGKESRSPSSLRHLQGVMKIVNAELQLDGTRLLLFAELKYKSDWNALCKRMFDYCLKSFRVRPRVWIQRKLV